MNTMATDRMRDERETRQDVALDTTTDVSAESLIPVRSRTRTLLEAWLPPIVALGVLVVLWIGAIRLKGTPPLVAPSPGDVINGIRNNASDLLTALRSTFVDSSLGLLLSIIVGVGLAVIMSQSRLLERAIFPYTTLAQTIPIFAIAPLIYSMVGDGHSAIVLVSLIIAVFPMIANTTLGLTSVDANQINLFRMYNANRRQELLHLRLPFAIPYILTGIRVSSGLSIIGVIVGQTLLGSGDPDGGGMGYEIRYAASQGDWGLLGAAAVVSALLGIVVFMALGALSNLALRNWHESAVQYES